MMHEPDGTWHEAGTDGDTDKFCISSPGVEFETLKQSLGDLSKLASETSEDDGVTEST